MKNWPDEWKAEFRQAYQQVRIEWFWACVEVAEEYRDYFASLLDKIIAK